jgi:CheY-like chemotaxis protein
LPNVRVEDGPISHDVFQTDPALGYDRAFGPAGGAGCVNAVGFLGLHRQAWRSGRSRLRVCTPCPFGSKDGLLNADAAILPADFPVSTFFEATNPAPSPLFVLDDDELDRVLFGRLMREAQLASPAKLFVRGEDLIDALIEVLRGAAPPLVCFLDVRMPGMNGFDVLRWIRCQRPLDGLPVVMLSSSEETRDLTEAQHAGAQCYVAKFPSAAQLRQIVSEAERVAAESVDRPFKLPCNLLLSPSTAATQALC